MRQSSSSSMFLRFSYYYHYYYHLLFFSCYSSSSSSLVLGGCSSFTRNRITTTSSSSSSSKTILQRKNDELQEDFYVRLLLHEESSSSSSSGGNINSRSSFSFNSLKQIHSHLFTSGFIRKSSPHLVAKIIIKYAKFGEIQSARSFFDGNINHTSTNNSFLWNTMLRAYANGGHSRENLELYLLMRRRTRTTSTTGNCNIGPNNYTFPFVLKSCASRASSSALDLEGKLIHGDIIRSGFGSCMFVEAALVDMCAKCGKTDDARRVFDGMSNRDLVCWTAMITAYEQSELPQESLLLFRQMQEQQQGLLSPADSVTAVSVASAVAQLGNTVHARSVHAHSIRNGFLHEDVFVGNSIIAMYAKCGNVKEARLVFDRMEEKDGISWNSMLSGYNENGRASEALLLFHQMQATGVKPNPVTALILVSSCAYLGSLQLGKQIHNFIIDTRIIIDTTLWNAIIDMYAKSGDLDCAVQMFVGSLPSERNVSSWNVMISGYGIHGHGKEALQLLSLMQKEGIEPNHITFTSLLSACSHAGLVDEGRECFEDMKKLSMIPESKHYACMVDILGRAGLLNEALDLIKEIQSEPNDSVWGALLLACRIHGNTELGELAAKNLFHLQPEHTGYYVLMPNIICCIKQMARSWETETRYEE